MYARCLEAISQLLRDNIPVSVVRLGLRDPPYMTPLIKQLLRKRNKLRRNCKISQANTLAAKINALTVQSRSQGLIKFSEAIASPKQLWAAVESSFGSTRGSKYSITDQLLNNVDAVNDYLQVFRIDRELSIVLFHRTVLFQVTMTLLLMTTLLSFFCDVSHLHPLD